VSVSCFVEKAFVFKMVRVTLHPAVRCNKCLCASFNESSFVRRKMAVGVSCSSVSRDRKNNIVAMQHGSQPKFEGEEWLENSLTVAVDVDEVLGRFVHSLNAFCLETYDAEYDTQDYFVYDFARVWQCSQDESNHRVHEFFTSNHFRDGIEVIPGSYDSLQNLKKNCTNLNLNVVTSRQHVIQEQTLEWLETHFPDTFDAVHFGNHFALEGTSKKKSEICADIGARVLIDDNPWYAMECAEAGIHVLLYDWNLEYPWSKTYEEDMGGLYGPHHENITRVSSWKDVEDAIHAYMKKNHNDMVYSI
jgi:5'(3')-deoxyribonucleotidase